VPNTETSTRYAAQRQEEVQCVACHWRGIGAYLTCHLLRDHDCPGCGKAGTLVCTGQDMYEYAYATTDGGLPLEEGFHVLGHRIITPREGKG